MSVVFWDMFVLFLFGTGSWNRRRLISCIMKYNFVGKMLWVNVYTSRVTSSYILMRSGKKIFFSLRTVVSIDDAKSDKTHIFFFLNKTIVNNSILNDKLQKKHSDSSHTDVKKSKVCFMIIDFFIKVLTVISTV